MLNGLKNMLRVYKHRRTIFPMLDSYELLFNRNDTMWGSITDTDEQRVMELTRKASAIPGPIIEVGTLFGFTTQLIATVKPAEKKLFAVEYFVWNPFGLPARDHRSFTKRVLRYVTEHCNTVIYDGTSNDFFSGYKGERPAMVFIDADHSYEAVKQEIAWARKLDIMIISGHDYNQTHPGVIRAVDEAFGKKIEVVGNVWSYQS
jgi:hypothetical protein